MKQKGNIAFQLQIRSQLLLSIIDLLRTIVDKRAMILRWSLNRFGVQLLLLCAVFSCASLVACGSKDLSEDPTYQELLSKVEKKEPLDKATMERMEMFRMTHAKSPDAQILMGRAFYLQGKDTLAVKAFTKAIKADPENANAYRFRGVARMAKRDGERAIRDLEKALSLDEQSADNHLELGRAYGLMNRDADAETKFKKAISLGTKDPLAHASLGLLRSAAGQHEKAKKHWLEVLKLDPTHANTLYNLGIHEYLRGDAKSALGYFQKFNAAHPEVLSGYAKMLQVHHKIGDKAASAAARKKLLDAVRNGTIKGRPAPEFCFDQFETNKGRVYAYERIDRGDEKLKIWYVFKLEEKGKSMRVVTVESSASETGAGGNFVLGGYEGKKHRTYPVSWPSKPGYDAMKTAALRIFGATAS